MPKPSNVNPGDRLGKLVIVKQINKKFLTVANLH